MRQTSMASGSVRGTPSLSVPQSQNTAPVLEFNCLYTHDVRKKQKKWQDGILRYHTFNKRVMIYDVPRNFVGYMHWTGDDDIQEGDELSLERTGVMVEVADCIGRTETDLSELRKSKKKQASAADVAAPARVVPTPVSRPTSSVTSRPATQLKHRSLNALLGTPKGPLGKAVLPSKSPFEQRQQDAENEQWEDGRPPKRPRMVTATKPLKQAETPLGARVAGGASRHPQPASPRRQAKAVQKEVIDLSDGVQPSNEFPGFSDDALGHTSSPSREVSYKTDRSFRRSSPALKQQNVQHAVTRSSSPAFQTQKDKPSKMGVVDITDADVPDRARSKNTPQDVTIRRAAKDHARENTVSERGAPTHPVEPVTAQQKRKQGEKSTTQSSQSRRSGQTLRLAASAPRKRTLLCQEQLLTKPKRLSSTSTDHAADTFLAQADQDENGKKSLTAEEPMAARLAKIEQKGGSTSSASMNKATKKPPHAPILIESEDESLPDGPAMSDTSDVERQPARHPQTTHEASTIELARMEQSMLPPAKPPPRFRAPTPQASRERSPERAGRTFKRTASDSSIVQSGSIKRIPGAPMRYTSSPTRRSRGSTPASATASRDTTSVPVPIPDKPSAATVQARPARPSKQKRPLQKSISLNVSSNGTSAVKLGRQFQAPVKHSRAKEPEKPKDLGPWSREAFDLFNFRPPGWDEDRWCMGDAESKTETPQLDGGLLPKSKEPAPLGLSGGVALPSFSRPVV